MRRRAQRRRFSPSGIWFVALVCGAAFTCWKFGWLPMGLETVDTGTLPDANRTDVENEAPGHRRGSGETISVDPIVFDAQSEPPVDGTTAEDAAQFAARQLRPKSGLSKGAIVARQWDDPAAPSLPPSFPAVPGSEIGGQRTGAANRAAEAASRNSETPLPAASLRPADSDTERPEIVQVANEVDLDLTGIDRMLEEGEEISAHRELSKLYWRQPEVRPAIQSRIDRTARSIYFSPQPHYMEPYVIQPGDQLRQVAKKYHVPWEYLVKLNQVDPRRIRAGQKLKVIKGPFAAVVDLGAFELTIHAHGYYVRRYTVGIGKDGRSPLGTFSVLNKVVNPQYTDPDGRVVDGDDPSNPLGERWIDIGEGFGIHGTIEPESIGKAESRGCIRMLAADVEEVYDLLDIGSEVVIRK